MKFERIRSDLNMIEADTARGRPITAADLFSLFRDLCEDIRSDTGTAAEKLPSGSVEELLPQLPWMGRMVTRHYSLIADQIMTPSRRADLDEKNTQLTSLSRQIEDAKAENAVLAAKQRRIEESLTQLDRESARKLELQKSCEALTLQLRQSSDEELFRLEQRHEALQKQEAELSARLAALNTDVEALTTLCDSQSKKLQPLQARKQELEAKQEELQALEAWFRELDMEGWSQKLEQLRQRCQCLTEVKTALEEDLRHLQDSQGITGVRPDPQLFRQTFEEMEKQITQYQALLTNALANLSSGR